MSPRPTTVVFDLGNVLIEWDRRFLFEQLIHDPDELDHFLDHVFTLDANRHLDSGVPLADVVARVADAHPEHRAVIAEFEHRWVETLGGVIDGSVAILAELSRRGTPLYALSNWGRDTFAMIEPRYEFLRMFDGMVISGREGVTKPDREIFDILISRYGFSPPDAVFIDDSSANVEAAADLGFDTIRFLDPEDLRRHLEARALL